MSDSKTFGERLNEIIELRGMTKVSLAEKCNVSKNNLTRWTVGGEIPNALNAVSLARSLGTTVEYLVTGKNPQGYSQEVLKLAQMLSQLDAIDFAEVQNTIEFKLSRKYLPETAQNIMRRG